jgi:hypothetical protein
MNRRERRTLRREVHWRQGADPKDPRFVRIEIRIPNGGMPPASYEGDGAFDRIRRFCRSYLCGVRGLPMHKAEDPAVEALLCEDEESDGGTRERGLTREMLADVPKHLLDAAVQAHELWKVTDLATLSFALVIRLLRQGQKDGAIGVLKLVTPGLSNAEAEYVIGALMMVESVKADPGRFDA